MWFINKIMGTRKILSQETHSYHGFNCILINLSDFSQISHHVRLTLEVFQDIKVSCAALKIKRINANCETLLGLSMFLS